MEGEALPEGAHVAVMVLESETDFVLTPALEEELLEALATADAGKQLSADELWGRLAMRHE